MVNLEIGFAMIKVLFFAHLRDLAGLDQIELPVDDMVYVKDLLGQFELHLPRELIDALSDESAMVSVCLLYTSPSPRDLSTSRMPSSA